MPGSVLHVWKTLANMEDFLSAAGAVGKVADETRVIIHLAHSRPCVEMHAPSTLGAML